VQNFHLLTHYQSGFYLISNLSVLFRIIQPLSATNE